MGGRVKLKKNINVNFATVIFIILIISSWFIVDYHQRQRIASEINGIAHDKLMKATIVVNQEINKRFALISGLKAFVQSTLINGEELSLEQFNQFSKHLYESVDGVRNISVAPNGVQKYVYPIKENETVTGHDLINDPRPKVRADVQKAIKTGKIILSGPYQLRQGGLGLIERLAVYNDDQFWGLVVIVLDVPPIMEKANLISNEDNFDYAIKSEGNVFWGESSYFCDTTITTEIELVDGSWILGMCPRISQIKGTDKLIISRVLGALVGLLLILLVWQTANKHRILIQAVKIRTIEIEKSKSKLMKEIEEHARVESKLKKQEMIFRKVSENFPDSFVTLVDKDLRILYTAGKELKNKKIDPEDFVGVLLEDAYKEDAGNIIPLFQKAFRGEEVSFQTILNNEYAMNEHVIFTIIPFTEDDGEIELVLNVVQNITQQKNLELELRKHKENLEELVESRTKELAFKNHELERFNQLFVGREFRIKELREKLKEFEENEDQS